MSMVSDSAIMDMSPEPKAAASLAGVRIERMLLDDDESRHLTKEDITHYRGAMSAPTDAPPKTRSNGVLDPAGVAGLVTLCAAAFAVILLI